MKVDSQKYCQIIKCTQYYRDGEPARTVEGTSLNAFCLAVFGQKGGPFLRIVPTWNTMYFSYVMTCACMPCRDVMSNSCEHSVASSFKDLTRSNFAQLHCQRLDSCLSHFTWKIYVVASNRPYIHYNYMPLL